METVLVAGARGFVGRALLPELSKHSRVIALTRGQGPSDPPDQVEWRSCDLFSYSQSVEALRGVDKAVYLVHSMLPAAHLTQAKFENLDVLVADNFARAAAEAGVKQIVYLGGIIPAHEDLSRHLHSRLEVEHTLSGYGVPVTSLRAAMIFGHGGSSMEVLVRLVKRLPLMLCPSWTATKSKPIHISDVVRAIEFVLKSSEHHGKVYDIGGDTLLSYKEMMAAVGKAMGRCPKIYSLPVLTPQLSRLWVSTITGAPRNLIKPLIETLKHDMVPEASRELVIADHSPLGFTEILEQSLGEVPRAKEQPRAFRLPEDEKSKHAVRSVQRLFVPDDYTIEEIAEHYLSWLPKLFSPIIRITQDGSNCCFEVTGVPWPLLRLERDKSAESVDRIVFAIRGGLLAKSGTAGRLEFRRVSSVNVLLAAIHDYYPTLPWFVYIFTQAKVHLWVMGRFRNYLRQLPLKA